MEEKQNSAVSLVHVSSIALRQVEEGYRPVLADVSADIYPGEVWGVYGDDSASSSALCAILGNQQQYYSGNVRVGNRGMMLQKNRILSHIFYIDAPDMLYPNMCLLEEMMFLTMRTDRRRTVIRQREMLDLLVELGFSHLALSSVSILTAEERMLALLLAAALSHSDVIVCDMSAYPLEQADIVLLGNILRLATKRGKTAVLATSQLKVIGMTCSHALLFHEGRTVFTGTVRDAVDRYDDVVCSFRAVDLQGLASEIGRVFEGYTLEIDAGRIFMHNPNRLPFSCEFLYSTLQANALSPEDIRLSQGRLENVYIALTRQGTAS